MDSAQAALSNPLRSFLRERLPLIKLEGAKHLDENTKKYYLNAMSRIHEFLSNTDYGSTVTAMSHVKLVGKGLIVDASWQSVIMGRRSAQKRGYKLAVSDSLDTIYSFRRFTGVHPGSDRDFLDTHIIKDILAHF